MEREIGCVYPAELVSKKYGIPNKSVKEVCLSTIDGIYLNYIYATSCLHQENIYLVFDGNLEPCCVRVKYKDGKIVEPWDISHSDITGLKEFAKEKGINPDGLNINELARKVLLKVNNKEKVLVPHYEK